MANDTTTEGSISYEGAELHYRTRGAGEPLLLLHGFTGTGGDWVHLFDLDDLARRFLLIMPDARRPRPIDESVGRVHAPAMRARRAARSATHLGIARCKAIGLSLGGNTLLHLATSAT